MFIETLGHTLDFLLTFQIKGAGGRSDEAMRHLQDHLSPSAFGTFRQCGPLNAITLAKRDDFLPLHVHNHLLSLRSCVRNHLSLATVACFQRGVKSRRGGG
jgi:hypothetical protein